MAHGAAHDPAQNVAAPFVGRQYAVGDQEARRAQVIGDDAMRERASPSRLDACRVDGSRNQRLEQIGVVVVVHALQHGGDALQAHAGVDRGLGQLDALAARQLLELHEDEVPDLDEAVAVRVNGPWRAAFDALLAVRIMVVENLRARSARSRFAHRPEVVGRRDAYDAVVGEAGELLPDAEGVVVVVVDGDHQAFLVEAVVLGDQVPGEFDRAFLEVIAEGEVAEHLEERVMARGVAHIVEVVVLAARAHAFLRRGRRRVGAGLLPGEDVLELHHAGVGEHQRRIVARHQRRRWHHLVSVALEVLQKRRSDLVDAVAAHVSQGPSVRMPGRPLGYRCASAPLPGQQSPCHGSPAGSSRGGAVLSRNAAPQCPDQHKNAKTDGFGTRPSPALLRIETGQRPGPATGRTP